ncbi:MAG: MGMT family protein [Candidatus Micrarchaeia archaeon]|jgi:O-6-methylguanine DNA methyltransferase
MPATPFEEKVFKAAKRVPRGKVSTYKRLAQAIGSPNASRAVGNALNKNRDPRVPCHRIVRSGGKAGGFARGSGEKQRILRQEGVPIVRGRVDPAFVIEL